METDEAVRRDSARRTRRSFLVAGAAAVGGCGFYQWVARSAPNFRQPWPLRAGLRWNARVSRALFGDRGLAEEYPVAEAVPLRTNGNFGLREALVPESYRLQVVGVAGAEGMPGYVPDVTAWEYRYSGGEAAAEESVKEAPGSPPVRMAGGGRRRGQEEAGVSRSGLHAGTPGLLLTMADVRRLPRRELVTEFKCIEGWSQVTQWGGVGLAEFIEAYPPERNARGRLPRYVYMETPDGDYYCGFDMRVCQHPQSLLVTEMSGEPLTQFHGAPLRLHMPIKYGYKQIKRIGLIAYTDERPDDYWTKLGYDWDAGL